MPIITASLTIQALSRRGRPFFLYLPHKAVHAEFQPVKRHDGQYERVEIPYPANMDNTERNYAGKPAWVRAQRDSWHGVDYAYHGDLKFDEFYRDYAETLLVGGRYRYPNGWRVLRVAASRR